MTATTQVLILGIGNVLLKDEGIGVHAVRRLKVGPLPAGTACLDGGTLSFTLAGEVGGAEGLIAIDAAELKAPPGTVKVFEGEAMDRFLGQRRGSSVHEVNLDDLLAMARLTGDLPRRRALVAVQPGEVDWGEALSPEVEKALARVVEEVEALLEAWYGIRGHRRQG